MLNSALKRVIRNPIIKLKEIEDGMKKEGMKTRLHKLSKVTNMPLSSKDLVRSGVMHKMNKIKKKGWTVVEIKEFLNQNNFKMQPFALQKLYNLKYGN